jgi:IS5 family transposase
MLRDRYDPVNLFTSIPTLSMRMYPLLTQIETLLDDNVRFQAVKADLSKRYPHTGSDGRPSIPVEVILRLLVVKNLYGWSVPQTTRRVLHGKQVPASEKIVRLFEPDTAIMRTGKPGKPTAFGHCVWLAAVASGRISGYAVLDGNPDEKAPLPPSLAHHPPQLGHPPDLLTGDRGRHSAANERDAQRRGVTEVVLPKPGTKSAKRLAYERQEWCRAGHNWHAGIESRSSGLKRRHKLARCRYHGTAGMERWVGLGVIAHDLHVIAQHLAA